MHKEWLAGFLLVYFPLLCGAAMIDKSKQVQLLPKAEGFAQVTDIQAVPGYPALFAVALKGGALFWLDGDANKGLWQRLQVPSRSEQGLLGLAFHPNFQRNRRFVLNYSLSKQNGDFSRVELWEFADRVDIKMSSPRPLRVIMEVAQPYANHNAGQLAFGPDGKLYIAWGDGGAGGDPHGNGQNTKSFLGAMLRIDIDAGDGDTPYVIPNDNPFINDKRFRPEIWAWGFRNPWRYSFDGQGRLWLADVGQNAWEEVSLVKKGNNYGWNILEGRHCYHPPRHCPRAGLQEPVYEYGHDQGNAITGGYVYGGKKLPWLRNRYVFGDFVSGRIWALDADKPKNSPWYLGQYPVSISSFGRGNDGELLVGDFQSGTIYMLSGR